MSSSRRRCQDLKLPAFAESANFAMERLRPFVLPPQLPLAPQEEVQLRFLRLVVLPHVLLLQCLGVHQALHAKDLNNPPRQSDASGSDFMNVRADVLAAQVLPRLGDPGVAWVGELYDGVLAALVLPSQLPLASQEEVHLRFLRLVVVQHVLLQQRLHVRQALLVNDLKNLPARVTPAEGSS